LTCGYKVGTVMLHEALACSLAQHLNGKRDPKFLRV